MIALVTGASSGIGAATARLLAREHGAELIVVARREQRLRELVRDLDGGDRHTVVAVDLTSPAAPATVAAAVDQAGGRLDLLVNNAGAAWRGRFGESGYENVRRHMELNFEAVLRLTEALLPALRAAAPSAIVNVGSTAGKVTRGNSGAYSASKFALGAWSDALYLEEKPSGVHVGIVLPGFAATEGFPQRELVDNARTRWIVSTPEKVAAAIVKTATERKAEVFVPSPYRAAAILRAIAPGLVRRALSGGGSAITPATGSNEVQIQPRQTE